MAPKWRQLPLDLSEKLPVFLELPTVVVLDFGNLLDRVGRRQFLPCCFAEDGAIPADAAPAKVGAEAALSQSLEACGSCRRSRGSSHDERLPAFATFRFRPMLFLVIHK
jgi:hypothetical protein